MGKVLSKVKTYSTISASPKINTPDATSTHFWVAGRVLSFFPQVNLNGFTFEKANCPSDIANTLLSCTADLEHLKPLYGATSSLIASDGKTNTTIGAIADVLYHDEGIDILVKNEKLVTQSFGFTPEDFEPSHGLLSAFSQESDYNKLTGSFIAVDKNDPTKIVNRIPYADGVAAGLRPSHVDKSGNWDYCYSDGNPVYYSVTPISFSGVGHVVTPADPSSVIYKLAASLNFSNNLGVNVDNDQNPDMQFSGLNPTGDFRKKHGVKGSDGEYHLPLPPKGHPEAKKYARAVLTRAHQVTKLTPEQVQTQVHKAREILGEDPKTGDKSSSGYAPMDTNEPNDAIADFSGCYSDVNPFDPENGPTGSDMNVWAGDLMTHPDIMTANLDSCMGNENADNDEVPDHHFLACYSKPEYFPTLADPVNVKHRDLEVKDKKGNLDRNKLIAAYHRLLGTRGDFQKIKDIPRGVKLHALAAVRHGLKTTNPNTKVVSSHMDKNPEIDALNAKILELTNSKSVSAADHQLTVDELAATKEKLSLVTAAAATEKETLLSSLKEKEDALSEINSKAVSSARAIELEKVLAFTEDEKKDETLVKSLASLSDDQFAIKLLQRENLALRSKNTSIEKSLASVSSRHPQINPVPFSGIQQEESLSTLFGL